MNFKFYNKIIEEVKGKIKLEKTTKQVPAYFKRNEKARHRAKKHLDDINKNHNHAWAIEVQERIKKMKKLNKTALFYRGNNITYEEMFVKWEEYASVLQNKYGITKGMEIPVCMANTPEFVYLLGGASLIGAKLNIFGSIFDKDYITKIIDECDANILFATDDVYKDIKDAVNNSHIKDKVVFSLTDSLPNHKNPYQELDHKFYDFKNKLFELKNEDNSIIDVNEFLSGNIKKYEFVDSNLDDVFTITYSSGSTNSTRPKAIVHKVRSFITMGIFHDANVSHIPSMGSMSVRASIPTHSNTDVISSISDSLMQGCKLALEPIYDKEHHLASLLINKANFDVSAKSFWLHTFKKIALDPNYQHIKLPFLLVPMAAGEPVSLGEEKFMNKMLRKTDAAKDITHLPVSPIVMSIAGGDCEHGGIFFSLFNALQPKLGKEDKHGLRTYDMVEVAVIDEKGKYLPNNTIGKLVANSECNMLEYKNNKEATDAFFMKTEDGKVWGNCNVYAKIDNNNKIHLKGRIKEEDLEVPPFKIMEEICKDTKTVLSCEVVSVKDKNDDTKYVAHIEFMPDSNINERETLLMFDNKCTKLYGSDVMENVTYRIRSNEEGFPLSGCGKRNNLKLIDEGISEKCVKPVLDNDTICLINAEDYYKNSNKMLIKKQ